MNEELNIRSDEVREVMEKMPGWLIRRGNTLLFFIILILITSSYFFTYPTIINSRIVVTTENPPATLVSRASGRISKIYVQDTARVNSGEIIAIIENPANYVDVQTLKNRLTYVSNNNLLFESLSSGFISENLKLGELQNSYASFIKLISDYNNFKKLDYHEQKIKSLKNEQVYYNGYTAKLQKQSKILHDKVILAQKQYKRDSLLFQNGVISNAEFEKSRSALLQQEYDLEQAELKKSSAQIEIAGLKKQILELQLNKNDELTRMKTLLQESFNKLQAEVSAWELKYILKAPIDGIITFTKIWSENQVIREGETVFTVIPDKAGEIIGKITLPIKGSGKVREGQEVNIKFDNYPYLEYGLVKGVIRSISLVPENDNYYVEVGLPGGLITFYDKKLEFTQEMKGVAEIITEKQSLLKRITNPLKYLIEKNLKD